MAKHKKKNRKNRKNRHKEVAMQGGDKDLPQPKNGGDNRGTGAVAAPSGGQAKNTPKQPVTAGGEWGKPASSWGDELDLPKGGKAQSCYETHPALEVKEGLYIYGGNCSNPVVSDADVYVGLNYTMADSPMGFPWHPGHSFKFEIPDMSVPKNLGEFQNLLDWVEGQIEGGQKVHVGCIGGHGRTGLVLAALVKQMTGRTDATQYVRDNYCKKAVESQVQVDWLYKHFGIEKVDAGKVAYGGGGGAAKTGGGKGGAPAKPGKTSVSPVNANGQIWGKNSRFRQSAK